LITFAQRFKYFRENVNRWTQEQTAAVLGVSRSTIAGYESEEKKRIPREETLNKIADVFSVSIDYLLCRTDDPNPKNKNATLPMEYNDPKINVAYLDGVRYELTPEVVRRLKQDIELFNMLKEKKNAEEK
jgi:transcriptional regulator with XRE-family HTH domain